MTLAHHTPAITYSGKVIRELGWGTDVGMEAHGGADNEDGDGKDTLSASASS